MFAQRPNFKHVSSEHLDKYSSPAEEKLTTFKSLKQN